MFNIIILNNLNVKNTGSEEAAEIILT